MSNGSSVFSGLFWKFSERFFAQGISFVVSVVLSRLLVPEDYGLIAMVMIFITIADVFVSSGFTTALIQKKNSTDLDFSTIFYCSLAVSIVMYAIIFITAPLISRFYNEPLITDVLRVFALKIPLGVYNSIQHAYVSRHMLFKRFFFSTTIGTAVSGIIGIALAYAGFGVWALIAQYFSNTIIDSLVLTFTVPWRPKLMFSIEAAKSLMGYGSKVLLANLSGTFFDQLRGLLIGKYYTSADLAFYNKGQQLPNLVSTNISQSVMAVLFPAMSNNSDEPERIKAMAKRAVDVMSLVLFPLLIGLASVSEPLVLVLYTEKWKESIPFVQILSISCLIGLMGTVSLQSIYAIGRSDVVLRLEFYKKPVYLLLLIIGIRYGTIAIAATMLLYSVYGTFVNMLQLRKYIDYGIREQIKDLLPATGLSVIMVISVLFVSMMKLSPLLQLLIETAIGAAIYILGCIFFKPSAWLYIIGLLKKKKDRTNE